MTYSYDATVSAYVRDVLAHIPRTSPDRQRIEEDLRAHLHERIEAGDPPAAAIAAMGDPKAVAISYLGEPSLRYAPLGRRLLAAGLDYALVAAGVILPIVCFLVILGGGVTVANSSYGVVHDMGDGMSVTLSPMALPIVLLIILVAFATSMLYFPVAEAVFGQTIGKWLFGLTVVTESGLAIGAKEAIIRRLPYIFQGLIFVDAIFVFAGRKHQRAFDHVAGTVVVQTR